MDIEELAREADETPRQIRYLISLGVVPPPEGGRRFASYGPTHLAAVRRYQALRAQGYAPAQITAILDVARAAAERVTVAFPLAPGVMLLVNPTALGPVPPNPDDVGRLATSDLTQFLAERASRETDDVP
ncbi:helix-turn-helix domain-containing protein [Falsiroseomonas sp. HW251]|uniref:helix-turn-helix domain-containing protein n=1 Tax=Falsiroseomonas sp. HW251 TaxID=3390998 RepID=UPI003D311455